MTRKDYQIIAAALADARPKFSRNEMEDATWQTWRTTREVIAQALLRDNPKFDLHRFIAATGSP